MLSLALHHVGNPELLGDDGLQGLGVIVVEEAGLLGLVDVQLPLDVLLHWIPDMVQVHAGTEYIDPLEAAPVHIQA